MNAQEILTTLEKSGKPSTAAIYKRHGAGENVFGTLTSEIGKLQKKIKVDHALARQLWKTGNAEARILALQIADPAQLTKAELDGWVKEASLRFHGVYISALVAKTAIGDAAMRSWTKSKEEGVCALGYTLLASRLKADAKSMSDADAEKMIATIEKGIKSAPNKARYAMNNALIAIGVFKPTLRKNAIAAAKRIGKVEVDHGDTNCKTPDAAAYIERAATRKS